MIGLDTNILVRYIMQDDVAQANKATSLIESFKKGRLGYFTNITLVEVIWVLESCYELKKQDIVRVIEGLLKAREIKKENSELLWRALKLFKELNVDYSDCLISVISSSDGCTETFTFDKKASKLSGMTLL
jgi:predicted nucleic-acid-binding protein